VSFGRKVVNAFTVDLPVKAVSLLIAMTLFVIVRSDRDAITGARVKVVYALPSDRVLVSDPPAELRLQIRGPWTRLRRFDATDLPPVSVDLTHFRGGALRLDENLVKLPSGLHLVSISPPEVSIEFVARTERDVPIQARLEGEPAEGYRITRVRVRPERAHVSGPQRDVEQLPRVPTRPLRIEGAKGPVSGEVALEADVGHVQVMDPERVVVEATIEPAIVERVLEDLPIKANAPIDPPRARLILRGPTEAVQKVMPAQVTLAVEPLQRTSTKPERHRILVMGLPAGVAAEVRPDAVTVRPHR
jgi:YbbR domain-containing protein